MTTATAERYVLPLGKVAYRNPRVRNNAVTLELELRDHNGSTEVSICGNIWNHIRTDIVSGGQNADTIRSLFKGSRRVRRICDLWDRWHLNTMQAGTPAQQAAIKTWRAAGTQYDYTAACNHLASIGLLDDNGYRYGSAWLTEEVPADVLAELRTLFHAQVSS